MNKTKQAVKIINFLKHPSDFHEKHTFGQSAKALFLVLAIDLGIALILSVIIETTVKSVGINIESHSAMQMLKNYPPALCFILAVCILPFFEELIFRFWLRYERFYPLRAVNFLRAKFSDKDLSTLENKSKAGWSRAFPALFWLSTIVFACTHLVNYPMTASVWLLSPLLVLPQAVTGFCIGFLRVKYNFGLGLLLHMLHNCVLVSMFMLPLVLSGFYSENLFGEKSVTDNQYYYLKIVEVEHFAKSEGSSVIDLYPEKFKLTAENQTIGEIASNLKSNKLTTAGRIAATGGKCYNVTFIQKKVFAGAGDSLVSQLKKFENRNK